MVYSDDLCDADKKPELERECEKAKNCDFQWFISQWSKVNAKERKIIFLCLLLLFFLNVFLFLDSLKIMLVIFFKLNDFN